MFSSEELENAKKIISRLAAMNPESNDRSDKQDHQQKKYRYRKDPKKKDPNDENRRDQELPKGCINLTPSQLIVIAGFLSGALEVNSVLVNKNQDVEILLSGSLKRRTQLDKVMEQVGKMPFDQVMRSIMDSASDRNRGNP